MNSYLNVADQIASDILAGRLRPGDRMPTQREFAYRSGIAASTASKAYGELIRRGLLVGEVGRGTFVKAVAANTPVMSEAHPEIAADLEMGFPVLPAQAVMQGRGLGWVARPDALDKAFRATTATGTASRRAIAARFLDCANWAPDPKGILFAAGGRQAIGAAIAGIVPVGGRLGVEEITYPAVKHIAGRLGIQLIPLGMDAEGILPEAIASAHAKHGLSAIYLQPVLHNPLGINTSHARLAAIAALLRDTGVLAIEDVIYRFLLDTPHVALAGLAPEHVVVVDSLSKRLTAGLTLGLIAPPRGRSEAIANGMRALGWTAPGFSQEATLRWINDGTVAAIEAEKRVDARLRQDLAARLLGGLAVRRDPRAYHLWLELPGSWRAEDFVGVLGRHGIAIAPGSAFAVQHGRAPNAVRLSLATPPLDALTRALDLIAATLRMRPGATGAAGFDEGSLSRATLPPRN
ncbi:MAG: GntR family transcriptional regulator [Rhodovulum sulfidophilum]|uniref:GntR family transcriptional regulator n=1 Tax=Rhodovulum sulfidophilum TaxID=35806 RepID=A0A2W5N2I6_RHOSU|nr:MAG: GntR family transcriptional regulator [Rhodovulum sulfidophilum]